VTENTDMKPYWKAFTVVDSDRPDLGGNCRHGDTKSITPKFWNYLVDRFAPRSMLDVGCGEGHALSFFQRQGVIAHGIDGLRQHDRIVHHPFAVHDLTRSGYVYPCDLVLCVEVVEHIEEVYLDNLLSTLTNAPIIVMTHAVPGQQGHHHVNLQPRQYWIDAFAERGYFLDPDTEWMKKMAADEIPGSYFGETGLVFIRP